MKKTNIINRPSKNISHGKRIARRIARFFATIFLGCFVFSAVAAPKTYAQMIKMDESPSHPTGAKDQSVKLQKAEDAKRKAAAPPPAQQQPVKKPPAQSPSPKQAQSGKVSDKTKSDKKSYTGIFKTLTPLSPVISLKTATFKGNFMSLANNPNNPSSYISRKNAVGGYFFESDPQKILFIKNLSVKSQYNRQLRNGFNLNTMNEWNAKIFGIDAKFSRTVGRTGNTPGSPPSLNTSDTRKTYLEYKKENGPQVSFTTDLNISNAAGASPSRTSNKNHTFSFNTPIGKKKIKFSLTSNKAANRNAISRDISRTAQTDIKLDIPFAKKLEFNLGYQLLGNRTIPGASAPGDNKKSTRTVGLSYIFAEKTKLTYLVNLSKNRNNSAGVQTRFDTTSRDLKFESPLSERLNFKAGNATTFDQSAGKTAVRNSSFAYDHKTIKWFPGATNVETRKQFTRSGANANTNYTFSVNTPLSYMDGRLITNLQHSLTEQLNLTNEQRNRSINQTLSVEYKFSQTLSVGTSFNRVKSSLATPSAITGLSLNHVRTDKATLTLPKLIGFKIPAMEKVNYVYTVSRNNTRTDIPAPSLTTNQIRKHGLDFMFKKEKSWNSKYSIERSSAISKPGDTMRSVLHKFEWTLEDFHGFKLTNNLTGAFQKNDTQRSGIFNISKKLGEKTSLYSNYEFLRNKSRTDVTKNARNRFLELGYESSF